MIPVDFTAVFDRSPNPYMLLDRQLRYVAANAAYLRVTAARLEDLIGRCVFDVFPNDPGDPDNASARMLRDSLDRVVRTREVDVLALIPYRVPDGREGGVSDRFWSATHTPILDDHGDVAFVLQHTVDVTALQTRKRAVGGSEGRDAEPARDQIEAGVLGRARHMQDANRSLGAETRDLRRLIREHERLEA